MEGYFCCCDILMLMMVIIFVLISVDLNGVLGSNYCGYK